MSWPYKRPKRFPAGEAVRMIYKHMATKEGVGALRHEMRQGFDMVRAEMNPFVRTVRIDYDSLAKRVKRLEEKVYRR